MRNSRKGREIGHYFGLTPLPGRQEFASFFTGKDLLTLCLQDALRVKKALSKAQNAGGVNPVKALQRRAGPF